MSGAEPAEVRDDEPRMGFLEHLDELRSCIRNAALALVGATIVTYAFRGYLFAVMARPFIDAWITASKTSGIGAPHMVFTSPQEGFMVLLKLALLAGLFLASPFIFREIWRFISPGLYDRERRWGLFFILASVLLFVGGAAFAYVYILPASYKFFLGYAGDSMNIIRSAFGSHIDVQLSEAFTIQPMITMDEYFGLTSMLLLVFGLVFELPLLLSVLAALGIVSAGKLWRFNRYAIVLFAVAGAFLTPGDLVVGQLAMTGSLTILYNLSIVVALLVQRRRKREEAALAAD
jgi:sec-independent protein translocase protein TatC